MFTFYCILLRFGSTQDIRQVFVTYICRAGLRHRQWYRHTIATVPMKQPWRTSRNISSHSSNKTLTAIWAAHQLNIMTSVAHRGVQMLQNSNSNVLLNVNNEIENISRQTDLQMLKRCWKGGIFYWFLVFINVSIYYQSFAYQFFSLMFFSLNSKINISHK